MSWMIAAALLTAGACTPTHIKPVASAAVMLERTPKLAELVFRALKDETVDGQRVSQASLTSASLFAEGHFHETWRLAVDLGRERPKELVLKVFRSQEKADENAINYGFAQQYGWPIPKEIVRGASASPLEDLPFLMMEYVEGGTLRQAVKAALSTVDAGVGTAEASGDSAVRTIAGLYGGLGSSLGELHRKSLRKRESFDVSGGKAFADLLAACAEGGWCDEAAQARWRGLSPTLDGPTVAFVHGDLYESQVLMAAGGGVQAFIDLDTAHFDDQARDVGAMLAHLLVVGPRTRKASWGVDNPTLAETEAASKAFLAGYKAACEIEDDAWADMLARSQAFMWLRLHEISAALAGSPHGAPVVDALTQARTAIFSSDPFRDAGLIE